MLPEPVNFPETKTIATLGEPFVIMAECICGHTRELHTLFLRRQLGAGVTPGKGAQQVAVPQMPSTNAHGKDLPPGT